MIICCFLVVQLLALVVALTLGPSFTMCHSRFNRESRIKFHHLKSFWIPACAGMTESLTSNVYGLLVESWLQFKQ